MLRSVAGQQMTNTAGTSFLPSRPRLTLPFRSLSIQLSNNLVTEYKRLARDSEIPDQKDMYLTHNLAPPHTKNKKYTATHIWNNELVDEFLVSPHCRERIPSTPKFGERSRLTCSWAWWICWSRRSHIRKQDESHPVLCPFYAQWTLESLCHPCWGRKSRTKESRMDFSIR